MDTWKRPFRGWLTSYNQISVIQQSSNNRCAGLVIAACSMGSGCHPRCLYSAANGTGLTDFGHGFDCSLKVLLQVDVGGLGIAVTKDQLSNRLAVPLFKERRC